MQCPNASDAESNGMIRCSILPAAMRINPSRVCVRCKREWVNGSPQSIDEVPSLLLLLNPAKPEIEIPKPEETMELILPGGCGC